MLSIMRNNNGQDVIWVKSKPAAKRNGAIYIVDRFNPNCSVTVSTGILVENKTEKSYPVSFCRMISPCPPVCFPCDRCVILSPEIVEEWDDSQSSGPPQLTYPAGRMN